MRNFVVLPSLIMPDIYKLIPAYLTTKRNLVQMVLFTAAFALAFINIYEPFGVNIWFTLTRWQLLFYSSLITLTGVLVIVLSRIIMYYRSKKHRLNYWQYLLWILIEIIAMALFYALYIKLFLRDERFFPDLIKVSVQNTAMLLLLPYSVSWLFFSWKDKNQAIAELSAGQTPADTSKLMLPFADEKGVLRFSVKMENLLYIEAADNYVNIYYLQNEKITRFILRNSMKNLDDALKGTPVARCHRRYMVNCDKVKIVRRDKEGVRLELDAPEATELPVTNTYLETVMSTFSHFAPASAE